MQVSLRWVNELIHIEKIPLNSLIEKLTLGGFEVEEIIEIKVGNENYLALDISSTANRSDSLSIQGISTEIAALLNKQLNNSIYRNQTFNWKKTIENLSITIPNRNNCSTFLAITIENITDHTVPKWIKKKLISSGIDPVNNLLDFQNYILLETGYPFAFYDLDNILVKSNNSKLHLSVSYAKNNQEFLANNDINYKLKESNLLVEANNIPISIAGIIENKNFSYSENTKSLIIEGSIFDASYIRQYSRQLGLRTERSARYEKSIKNAYLVESFYRLISLLRIRNQDLKVKFHNFMKIEEQALKPIFLKYQTMNEILGPIQVSSKHEVNFISPELVSNYLSRLNFEFSYDESKSIWKVQIPQIRSEDIIREIDLIEEIGRLHGFNNFLTTLPKIKKIGNEDSSYKTRKKITACLLNLGFNELIHYSLVSKTTFLDNEVKLINPLISDYSNLRSSLLPGLIKTVQENIKQGNLALEGFEYGHIFSFNQSTTFKEKEHIAGIFGGNKTKLNWSEVARPLNWFEAKGKIEQLFNQLNLSVCWEAGLDIIHENILHPYRCARLSLINGNKLGTFGQIHPILADQLNLSLETYLFELDVEIIEQQIQKNTLPIYKEYSTYPKIIKDLSFIVKQDITFSEIERLVLLNGTQFLSQVNLLDEYRGESIPDESTSLCLQLVFQSNEKTLQNKTIEDIIKNLQLLLTEKFNAVIRD